jgi:hypothetical protein
MTPSSQLYSSFLPWEPYLSQIISRYPEPSTIYCSGRSPSTVRQNLQQALSLLTANPHFSSVISHDQALLVERAFVFGTNPDGSVYIGPRRSRKQKGQVHVAVDGTRPPEAIQIPPIDCSDPTTLTSLLHLKNFDHLPFPISITNFNPPFDISINYPNVEIITNADNTLTLL